MLSKQLSEKKLEMLYKDDGSGGRARTTKLTDKHINPQAYDNMKVNNIKSLKMKIRAFLYNFNDKKDKA